jgi:hypothetical protein
VTNAFGLGVSRLRDDQHHCSKGGVAPSREKSEQRFYSQFLLER